MRPGVVGYYLLVFAIFLSFVWFLGAYRFLRFPWQRGNAPVSASLNGKSLMLETVRTPAEREQGLSGRRSIPRGYAMRFIFDTPGIYPFWMQGMWVSLDIVWVRDGIVVERTQMDPPRSFFSAPSTYTPRAFANEVYEFASGEADTYGLATGTRIDVIY